LLAQEITDLISLDTYVNLLGQEVSCVAMNLGEGCLTQCHLTCIGTAQIRILCDWHK